MPSQERNRKRELIGQSGLILDQLLDTLEIQEQNPHVRLAGVVIDLTDRPHHEGTRKLFLYIAPTQPLLALENLNEFARKLLDGNKKSSVIPGSPMGSHDSSSIHVPSIIFKDTVLAHELSRKYDAEIIPVGERFGLYSSGTSDGQKSVDQRTEVKVYPHESLAEMAAEHAPFFLHYVNRDVVNGYINHQYMEEIRRGQRPSEYLTMKSTRVGRVIFRKR